jgi:hypothetical protein
MYFTTTLKKFIFNTNGMRKFVMILYRKSGFCMLAFHETVTLFMSKKIYIVLNCYYYTVIKPDSIFACEAKICMATVL